MKKSTNKLVKCIRAFKWVSYMFKKGYITIDDITYSRIYYSQFGEDILLESLFGLEKKGGFYVDIGAFNPFAISNTYLFYRKGWAGINIEPNPEHFSLFPIHRQRDVNLNIAISQSECEVEFKCDGPYSGICDDTHLYSNRNKNSRTVKVNAMPLETILSKHLDADITIDFMSVDCEGHDLIVLQSNNWFKYRPKILLVEQHGVAINSEVYQFMINNDYSFYCKVGFTLVFVEKKEELKFFPKSS